MFKKLRRILGFDKRLTMDDLLDRIEEKKEEAERDQVAIVTAEQKGSLERVTTLENFIGNERAVERIKTTLAAHQIKGGKFPNILFYGNAGCGKTTLARIIASQLGIECYETTGSALNKQLALIKFLSFIERGVIFIDEVHGIIKGRGLSEDVWLPLLEENTFHHSCTGKKFVEGNYKHIVGPSPLVLSDETSWIGATTDPGLLNSAIRRRFEVTIPLEPYTLQDMKEIVMSYARRENIRIEEVALEILAERARMTPALAVKWNLRQAIDCAVLRTQSKNNLVVMEEDAINACTMMSLGPGGVMTDDLIVLKALRSVFPDGLGLKTLAGKVNINSTTVENMVLPFLQQNGWVRTGNKRFLTDEGIEFLQVWDRYNGGDEMGTVTRQIKKNLGNRISSRMSSGPGDKYATKQGQNELVKRRAQNKMKKKNRRLNRQRRKK